jgi:hypothetical protein
MALHAMWVHGSMARAETVVDGSRVTGVVHGSGIVFSGDRVYVTQAVTGAATIGPFDPADPFHHSQKGYWFHFAVPAPVIVGGRARTKLQTVFVLWQASPGVEVWAVQVFDGINRIASLPAGRMTETSSHRAPSRPLTGIYRRPEDPDVGRCVEDLIDGFTRFPIDGQKIYWGLDIAVAAAFTQNGSITFYSAGADFDVV